LKFYLIIFLLLLVSGCSGITPCQPRNNREEGPQQGLFTGDKGAFEIGIFQTIDQKPK
jgi:hypothetical protein